WRSPLGSGSSPLAWGEGRGQELRPHLQRFIPTRVGRGPSVSTCPASRSVHPHSRGERGLALAVCAAFGGSSPLAWGEGADPRGAAPGHRFIPTRVGRG